MRVYGPLPPAPSPTLWERGSKDGFALSSRLFCLFLPLSHSVGEGAGGRGQK
jgi:hypothetical protein